jgi:alpha-ketoglutarate-dependent taurine dioxygenase
MNKEINNIITNIRENKNLKFFKKKGKILMAKLFEEHIKNKKFYFLIKLNNKNKKNLIESTKIISGLFGKTLKQNISGDKIVSVSPRVNLINKYKKNSDDYLRYHQTNKGGSIHTDGPQISSPPKLLIMSCVSNSGRGGETILVNGKKIFQKIKKTFPKEAKELTKKFFFERRGFSRKKNLYLNKPIFETKRYFQVRYLREYIITAYKKKSIKLPNEKIKSLNLLDKFIENKKLQNRFKMKEGEIVLINNHQLLHGRTGFSINNNKPRNLLRVWVQ